MKTENVENVLDYWKLSNGSYIVKMKKYDRLDDDCHIKITPPTHLGALSLRNSKRNMNKFNGKIDGLFTYNF